jgi:hypothetical protein
MKPHSLPRKQTGISLIVTLLVTVLLSLLALYGAGVLVLDTRSAANDYRYREAKAAAESGVDQGFSLVNANRANIAAIGSAWTTCTATTLPCLPIRSDDRTNWQVMTVTAALTTQPTTGSSFTLFLLTPTSGDSSGLVFNIVATGLSADGTSTATVKQGVYFYPLILGNVDTPLAAASNIPLNGNYCIVTNPNGGGSGVEVSAWSSTAFTTSVSGSFSSVQPGDFDGSCPNPASAQNLLSTGSSIGPDLINDPNFPPDLFQFLFGVPAANYQVIKDTAQVVANCSGLNSTSSGLVWVTGDCDPSAIIGSATSPVLLVVEGSTNFVANDEIYGLLYMFDPGSDSRELKTAGTAHMHGAIIAHDSNVDLDLQGTFIIEYDEDVLKNLKNSPSARALARIPGSWSDVQ